MSKITKILWSSKEDDQKIEYDISTTFDNVVVSEDNGYTLKKLYDYLINFFTKGSFSVYSKNEPKNTQVKEWLQTEEWNSEGGD